jgi:hypothetical protein
VTSVRSRRGRRVHSVAIGIRRDLDPASIPTVTCGRPLKNPVVVDEPIDCVACLEIATNAN